MRVFEGLKQHTYTPNSFYDHMMRMEEAMGADMKLEILPAMTGAGDDEAALDVKQGVANATGGYETTVTVKLLNDDDEVHTWFNGKLNVIVHVDSTDGTVAINDGSAGDPDADVNADLEFSNGELQFDVVLGGTWSHTDSDWVKVSVDNSDVKIMNKSVRIQNHYLIDIVED